jgi:hypothetical protein
MIRRALALLLSITASTACAAGPAPQSPYLRPEFRRLMDAVTLQVSFDAGTMTPDMAEGPKYAPQLVRSRDPSASGPRFAPGLIGQALVLGSGAAIYPRSGNVLLENRGALAFWVRPEGWQRPDDGNTVFTMTTDAGFYVERQGPARDPQGRVRCHEAVLYLARDEGQRLVNISCPRPWENGRWYLVVVNWSWPTFELSVNGEPFSGRGLSGVPKEGSFGGLVVGNRGAPRGLLDEFMAFRRPLKIEEVRLLWSLRGK